MEYRERPLTFVDVYEADVDAIAAEIVDFALAFHAAEAARLPVTELKALCGTCETCARQSQSGRCADGHCVVYCQWWGQWRKPTDGCTDHEPKEASDGK